MTESYDRDQHPRRCTATSVRSGARCRRFAIKGGTVCYLHGGGSPQAKAKAAQRLELAKAEASVAKIVGSRPQVRTLDQVLEHLVDLAGEALTWKEAIREKVDALTSYRYSAAGAGTEQLRAEVGLYERALDRSAKFVDMIGSHDFERIRLRLSERTGQLLAGVIREILNKLDLTEEQWERAVVVVPAELRRVAQQESGGQESDGSPVVAGVVVE